MTWAFDLLAALAWWAALLALVLVAVLLVVAVFIHAYPERMGDDR